MVPGDPMPALAGQLGQQGHGAAVVAARGLQVGRGQPDGQLLRVPFPAAVNLVSR